MKSPRCCGIWKLNTHGHHFSVNRFVKSRSFRFSIVAWACIIALSADFANIDDLINIGTVLHDDQDVLSGQSQDPHSSDNSPASYTSAVPGLQVCACVDQDSPSLAADVDACEFSVVNLPIDPGLRLESTTPPGDALYIKYHRLLI